MEDVEGLQRTAENYERPRRTKLLLHLDDVMADVEQGKFVCRHTRAHDEIAVARIT